MNIDKKVNSSHSSSFAFVSKASSRRFIRTGASLIAMLACTSAAASQIITGVLEMAWGDLTSNSTSQTSLFELNLVDDSGQRYELDPTQAQRAAEDLYSLSGRRVAMTLAQGSGLSNSLSADAIVDVTDLYPKSSAATTSSTIDGPQPWASILCKFAGTTAEPQSLDYFNSMFDNEMGRLGHYWQEVSYGKASIAGSAAFGWFNLPHDRAYYLTSTGKMNLTKLFTDCVAAADHDVNFAPFVGINLMFNETLDCCTWGGTRQAVLDGVSKVWRVTWQPPWSYQNVALIAHEMGHGFGLPHGNNSDNDNDPYDNPWDSMSDAWHNATYDSVYGAEPKHLSVYHRNQLGWIDPVNKRTISQNGYYANLVLDRASLIGSTNMQMITITLPNGSTTRYYTIEARKKVGTYEGALAGNAVIIHSIDKSRREPAWIIDTDLPLAGVSNNEGSMFTVGESYTSPDGVFSLTVEAETEEGFTINIQRGQHELYSSNFE